MPQVWAAPTEERLDAFESALRADKGDAAGGPTVPKEKKKPEIDAQEDIKSKDAGPGPHSLFFFTGAKWAKK